MIRLLEANNKIGIMRGVVDEVEEEDEEEEIEMRIKVTVSALKTIVIQTTNNLNEMIEEVKAKEDQIQMAQEIVIMLICKMILT